MPFTQDPDQLWRLTDGQGLFVYKATAISVVFDRLNSRVIKLGPAERMRQFFHGYMNSVPYGNYGLDLEEPVLSERTDWTLPELNAVFDTGIYHMPTPMETAATRSVTPVRIGLIGTAGRDPKRPMTRALFVAMFRKAKDVLAKIAKDRPVILVSGGAAWADHIAVSLKLAGAVHGLRLHMPVPFVRELGRFSPSREEGRVANYYHDLFTQALSAGGTQHSSFRDLLKVFTTPRTEVASYSRAQGSSFHARNKIIAAESEWLVAFTWSPGPEPMDGGTLHTWQQSKLPPERRVHVSLLELSSGGLAPKVYPAAELGVPLSAEDSPA